MNEPEFASIRFIDEEISVQYDQALVLRKKPRVPDRFLWRDQILDVIELIAEGFDFSRKGRMGRNMRPEHLRRASRRGSWGVGRYTFRVRIAGGRVFDLYYDRAPADSADRSGHWYLWRELGELLD